MADPNVMDMPEMEIDVSDTLGPCALGFAFAFLIGGMGLQQAFEYQRRYPNDRMWFKGTVFGLFLMNLAHTGCLMHNQYYWDVMRFGNPLSYNRVPISYGVSFLLGGSIGQVVQTFYAYRIYVLSKSWYIPVFIAICGLVQNAFAWTCGIYSFTQPFQAKFQEMLFAVYIWFVVAAANDIIISLVLVFYLQRAKGLFESTNSVLNKISLLTLQTNSITAVLAILVIGFFATVQNGWNNAFNYVVSKLYIVSLMTSLNSRASFEDQRGVTTTYTQNSIFGNDKSNRFVSPINTTTSQTQDNPHQLSTFKSDAYHDSGVVVERSVAVNFDRGDPEYSAPAEHPYNNLRKAALEMKNGNGMN